MKTSKPFRWCVITACITALTLMGCGQQQPKTVKIAHLAPLTGAASSYGVHLINAAKLAVEEINAKGGVKLPDGTMAKIEYTEVDETSNSANAIEAVKKAISLEPVVMMGPNRSGGVLAAEKLWKEAKIATITDATSPMTTRQGNPYTFRMQISSEYWIPLLVKTAVEKYGIKKLGVAGHPEGSRREYLPHGRCPGCERVSDHD